jgi:hypothetical protein
MHRRPENLFMLATEPPEYCRIFAIPLSFGQRQFRALGVGTDAHARDQQPAIVPRPSDSATAIPQDRA